MLKPDIKKSRSPRLAATMAALFRRIKEEGLMASLSITDGEDTEIYLSVDPTWSCIRATRDKETADITLQVRTASVYFAGQDVRKKLINRTSRGLAVLFQATSIHQESLTAIMGDLQHAIAFDKYGEEFKGHTMEPPDPDRVPGNLKEAAAVIHATLTTDQIAWVKSTKLYEALPYLHDGFAQRIREMWFQPGGMDPHPLREYVRTKYGLFGHPDDITKLVFNQLWGMIRDEPDAVIDAGMALEADGMAYYWGKEGINPATGERGVIV